MRFLNLFLLTVFLSLPLPALSDTKKAEPANTTQAEGIKPNTEPVPTSETEGNRPVNEGTQSLAENLNPDILKDLEYIRELRTRNITVEDVIAKTSLDDSRVLSTARLVQALSHLDPAIRKMANSDLNQILKPLKNSIQEDLIIRKMNFDYKEVKLHFSFEVQVLLLNTAFWDRSSSAKQGSVYYALNILKQLGQHDLINLPVQLVLLDIVLTDISLAGGSKQHKAIAILNRIKYLDHQVQEMAVQALLAMDKESQPKQDRIRDSIEKIMTKTSLKIETESLLVDHLYHPNPTIRQTVHHILSSENKLFFQTLEKLSQSLFKPESRFVEVLEQTASLLIKHLKAGYKRGYHYGLPTVGSDAVYRILLEKVQEPGTKKFRGRQVARIFLSLAQYLHEEAVQLQLAQWFRQNPDLMSALKLESIFGKMPPLHAGAKSELMAFINDPNTPDEYKKIAIRELKQNQRSRLSRTLSKCARVFMP